VHLRARDYPPDYGRFLTRDSWDGDANLPITYNKWAYANGNPVRFSDPSGKCIFTGVDTLACLIALAVGIPAIAGITTGAWNYYVSQGGGVGGNNQYHQNCIDWS
jgi:hypothetical protein